MIEPMETAVAKAAGTLTARRRNPARARRDYVTDAKVLLQQRFRETLRLDDVARALHVSTYHLCRIFKEETGVPIHRYLTRLRLLEALESLTAGAADLTDLALSLGFASHSHFSNAFRKEFGISPREVRRRVRPITPRECPASGAARPPLPLPARSSGGSPLRPPA
jgi:AraC-like DNA-binding protein